MSHSGFPTKVDIMGVHYRISKLLKFSLQAKLIGIEGNVMSGKNKEVCSRTTLSEFGIATAYLNDVFCVGIKFPLEYNVLKWNFYSEQNAPLDAQSQLRNH